MFDSTKELLDKIRLGEDSFLEYKEARFSGKRVTEPSRNSLADELASFANSRGGVFVLGVRDYSIYGSKIRLRLFADRLELYSPGTIPNTMDVESLVHLQSSRNEILTSLLAKCPVQDRPWLTMDRSFLMDKRGEGVRIILDNSKFLSGREPEYRLIGDSELLLTIYGSPT